MTAVLRPGFDTVERTALLGVQFRDAVDGRVVSGGLRVVLQDLWQPHRQRLLAPNRSGIFVLHTWPGMRGFGSAEIGSPSDPGRFRLTADDTSGRYLATAVFPEMPSEGLWSPAGAWLSPPDRQPHVPLYSAPTRPEPSAMGCIRADLRLASDASRPAGWAHVEAWHGSVRLGDGIADGDGRLMLLFPLPRPLEATLRTSPAGRPGTFEWNVSLRARWRAVGSAAEPPDLDHIAGQPSVAMLRSIAPDVPLPALTLRAGETLQAAQWPSSFVFIAA